MKVTDRFNAEYEVYEKTCGFTGHRPDKLGGYSRNNPFILEIKKVLLLEIEKVIVEEGVYRFNSGGALGIDQLAFDCVHELKEKYPFLINIVSVPFEGQYTVWKYKDDVDYYFNQLGLADEIVYVDTIDRYKTDEGLAVGDYSAQKMLNRNKYMVDKSKYLIAVYDGSRGGTGHCVNYAIKKNRVIVTINPDDYKDVVAEGFGEVTI